MAISDVLSGIGEGLEKGAAATGRVAGALAPAIGKAVVNEEAGYAPQIAAEGRQHAQAMEDQQINAKAGLLENQLKQLQSNAPLFNNDGSVMTPQQRTAAISGLSNQFTQLYSHPRHAGTLMEKLRQAVSPGGMTAGAGQTAAPSTPASAMQGFTAAAPAGYQEAQDEQAQERQALQQRNIAMQGINAWADQMKAAGIPEDQINQAKNEAIERAMGATGNLIPKTPKLSIQGGILTGGVDEHGRSFSVQDILAGNAGKELQSQAQSYQTGEQAKQAAIDAKAEAATKRTLELFSHQLDMQNRGLEKAMELGNYRDARKELNKADEGYQASIDRSNTMDRAASAAKNGDQQAMFAILSNHIAMTLQQPGVSARPTKTMYDEAAGSLPWMQGVSKKFDSDGYLTGLTLSPDQIDKMTSLAHEKVQTQKEHIDRIKDEYQEDLNPAPIGNGRNVGNLLKKPNQVNPANMGGASKPVNRPQGAVGTVTYQGKKYWVDKDKNNLGEAQ